MNTQSGQILPTMPDGLNDWLRSWHLNIAQRSWSRPSPEEIWTAAQLHLLNQIEVEERKIPDHISLEGETLFMNWYRSLHPAPTPMECWIKGAQDQRDLSAQQSVRQTLQAGTGTFRTDQPESPKKWPEDHPMVRWLQKFVDDREGHPDLLQTWEAATDYQRTIGTTIPPRPRTTARDILRASPMEIALEELQEYQNANPTWEMTPASIWLAAKNIQKIEDSLTASNRAMQTAQPGTPAEAAAYTASMHQVDLAPWKIWKDARNFQRSLDRNSGCSCDPPGSGEEHCTGHCLLRAEAQQWRGLAMEAYGSIERGDITITRTSLLSGYWYRLTAAVKAHLDKAVDQAVREEEGLDAQ